MGKFNDLVKAVYLKKQIVYGKENKAFFTKDKVIIYSGLNVLEIPNTFNVENVAIDLNVFYDIVYKFDTFNIVSYDSKGLLLHEGNHKVKIPTIDFDEVLEIKDEKVEEVDASVFKDLVNNIMNRNIPIVYKHSFSENVYFFDNKVYFFDNKAMRTDGFVLYSVLFRDRVFNGRYFVNAENLKVLNNILKITDINKVIFGRDYLSVYSDDCSFFIPLFIERDFCGSLETLLHKGLGSVYNTIPKEFIDILSICPEYSFFNFTGEKCIVTFEDKFLYEGEFDFETETECKIRVNTKRLKSMVKVFDSFLTKIQENTGVLFLKKSDGVFDFYGVMSVGVE